MTGQDKFKIVVEGGIQRLLKPLGFRKKSNNFYSRLDGIGHLVNVQKSAWNNKDQISFTINIGIFVPEYWQASEVQTGKQMPIFPSEIDCFLRTRIGQLKGGLDEWYTIDFGTDTSQLVAILQANIADYILPYFRRITTRDVLLEGLLRQTLAAQALPSLIVFGVLGEQERGRIFYNTIIKQHQNDQRMLAIFHDCAVQYQLV